MVRGYAAIGLVRPKSAANVGGVVRAAGCYGASMIAIHGERYYKIGTDVQKGWRHIPVLHDVQDLRAVIPFNCVPVAIEIVDGARCLHGYTHPERAFYIFGPEDGSINRDILSWCRDVVSIPTAYCMNLAATANVVLYDRQSKQQRIARRLA